MSAPLAALLALALAASTAPKGGPVAPAPKRAPAAAPGPKDVRLPAAPAAAHYGDAGAADLGPLGEAAVEVARAAFPKRPPRVDAALSRAARALAEAIAAGLPFEEVARPDTLRFALARAGATSPEMAPLLVRASDRGQALRRLRTSLEARDDTPDLLGVGAATRDGLVSLVALTARRRVELAPFPIEVAPGTPHRLRGALLPPLRAPRVFLTAPGGRPAQLEARVEGRRFEVLVPFAGAGRHTLEILGDGPSGPEVAAILEVFAGTAVPAIAAAAAAPPAEPVDRAGREALAARLAAEVRRARGLAPLRIDPRLAAAARAYAEEIARTGRFAHHSPISGTVEDRVRRAGYRAAATGENLAQAPAVVQAHETLIASPGHLANLLDPRWTDAGFGVAEGAGPAGSASLVLVQVFAALRE